MTKHYVTYADVRADVEQSLLAGEHADHFDVDGIVREIINGKVGIVGYGDLEPEAFWEIVSRHDRAVTPSPITAVDTVTVRVNVYDGIIEITADGFDEGEAALPNGDLLPVECDVEPWGVDEENMDRADAEVRFAGLRRISDWVQQGEQWTATAVTA